MTPIQIKLIIAAVIVLVIFSLGAVAGWKLQSGRVENAQAAQALAIKHAADCQRVNAGYVQQIKTMKEAQEKLKATYEQRITTKGTLVKKISAIDQLKPVKVQVKVKDETNNNTDPVLSALNGVWPDRANRKD